MYLGRHTHTRIRNSEKKKTKKPSAGETVQGKINGVSSSHTDVHNQLRT